MEKRHKGPTDVELHEWLPLVRSMHEKWGAAGAKVIRDEQVKLTQVPPEDFVEYMRRKTKS